MRVTGCLMRPYTIRKGWLRSVEEHEPHCWHYRVVYTSAGFYVRPCCCACGMQWVSGLIGSASEFEAYISVPVESLDFNKLGVAWLPAPDCIAPERRSPWEVRRNPPPPRPKPSAR